MDWESIQENWKWIGSLIAALTGLLTRRRWWDGFLQVLRAIRAQWHLNMTILDLQNELVQVKRSEERARKAEAEANDRTDELAATLQMMMTAGAAVQDARARGYLVTSPPSSLAPTPSPAPSSTSPPKQEAPMTVIHRSD